MNRVDVYFDSKMKANTHKFEILEGIYHGLKAAEPDKIDGRFTYRLQRSRQPHCDFAFGNIENADARRLAAAINGQAGYRAEIIDV